MSKFTDCLACLEGPITWETILRLVIVKDSDGSHYLNTKFNEKEQCDDYEPAVSCASHTSAQELVRAVLVEDDCGMCALNFIANICDACPEEPIQ